MFSTGDKVRLTKDMHLMFGNIFIAEISKGLTGTILTKVTDKLYAVDFALSSYNKPILCEEDILELIPVSKPESEKLESMSLFHVGDYFTFLKTDKNGQKIADTDNVCRITDMAPTTLPGFLPFAEKAVYFENVCNHTKGVMRETDFVQYMKNGDIALDNHKDVRPVHNSPKKSINTVSHKWTPWRTYTKEFKTIDGMQSYTFSVRTNRKRTVCVTHVVDEVTGQTRAIRGIATCNLKAGDVFEAEAGVLLAIARCETKLSIWLENQCTQKLQKVEHELNELHSLEDELTKQKHRCVVEKDNIMHTKVYR